jgi:hypothetical protein
MPVHILKGKIKSGTYAGTHPERKDQIRHMTGDTPEVTLQHNHDKACGLEGMKI